MNVDQKDLSSLEKIENSMESELLESTYKPVHYEEIFKENGLLEKPTKEEEKIILKLKNELEEFKENLLDSIPIQKSSRFQMDEDGISKEDADTVRELGQSLAKAYSEQIQNRKSDKLFRWSFVKQYKKYHETQH